MPRILIVDDQPPQATRDGASLRMTAILGLLAEAGHAVDFASVQGWPGELAAPRRRLAALGVGILDAPRVPERLVAEHAGGYDVIVLSRLSTAARLLEPARRAAPDAHVVYDAMHLAHAATYRRAKASGSAALLAHALRERREELAVARAADAILAVSADEARLLAAAAPGSPVGVVAAGPIGATPPAVEIRGRRGGLFIGYLATPENRTALTVLVEEVWPRVLARVPGAPLHVVGAGAPDWLVRAEQTRAWLRVAGHVVDAAPWFAEAAVSMAPMAGGAGIKTKVVESMAAGVPVVGTAAAFAGIPVMDGEHGLLAESADGLAAAAAEVLLDHDTWQRLSAGGLRIHREHFGREAALAGLEVVLGPAAVGARG